MERGKGPEDESKRIIQFQTVTRKHAALERPNFRLDQIQHCVNIISSLLCDAQITQFKRDKSKSDRKILQKYLIQEVQGAQWL